MPQLHSARWCPRTGVGGICFCADAAAAPRLRGEGRRSSGPGRPISQWDVRTDCRVNETWLGDARLTALLGLL